MTGFQEYLVLFCGRAGRWVLRRLWAGEQVTRTEWHTVNRDVSAFRCSPCLRYAKQCCAVDTHQCVADLEARSGSRWWIGLSWMLLTEREEVMMDVSTAVCGRAMAMAIDGHGHGGMTDVSRVFCNVAVESGL